MVGCMRVGWGHVSGRAAFSRFAVPATGQEAIQGRPWGDLAQFRSVNQSPAGFPNGCPGGTWYGRLGPACLKALRAVGRPALKRGHYLSRGWVLGAQGCAQSLQALPPLLYEAH